MPVNKRISEEAPPPGPWPAMHCAGEKQNSAALQAQGNDEFIIPLPHECKHEGQKLSLYVAGTHTGRKHYEFSTSPTNHTVNLIYCTCGKALITVTGNHAKKAELCREEGIVAWLPGTRGVLHVNEYPFRAVLLRVGRDFLKKWLTWVKNPLLHGRPLFPREDTAPYMERIPLPVGMSVLLHQVTACRASGPMSDVYLTAKKYEMFYKQMALLCGDTCVKTLPTITESQAAHDVYQQLIANLNAPPCLTKLAASVGLNRGKLTSLFRQIYGDTVFGILRRERLKQACTLLEADLDKNITEIAYVCGFSNPGHLTKSFIAQFGITPKQYRRHGHPPAN